MPQPVDQQEINVQEHVLSVASQMCLKWSKTGRDASKMGKNGSKWEEGGGKAMHSLLAHRFPCENGLLSALSGKGWTKRPFSDGSSSQCEALRTFSTLLGHFGVILWPFGASNPQICQVPKSAKSHSTGPKSPMVGPKWRKLKI